VPQNLTWTPDTQGRDTRWEGGRIRYDRAGRATFIIERMVQGRRYMTSTRAHTISAALKHLARFEADPVAYTRKDEAEEPLYLTEELQTEFLDHSRDVKKNVANWVTTQRMYLKHWAEDLFGVDLRRLDLRKHIDPALLKRETVELIRFGRHQTRGGYGVEHGRSEEAAAAEGVQSK